MLIQKPPIKVDHVKILENIMQGISELKAQDRVAAGFFPWMIYARAWFSDAQAASTIVEDVIGTEDGPDGFIEAQVHRSKTAITLERKTRYLPMAGRIVGVIARDKSWALEWMKAIRDCKLPVGSGRPLLPAQTDAGWSSLPVSAHVAGRRSYFAGNHWVHGLESMGWMRTPEPGWVITHVEQVVLSSSSMPGTPWPSLFEI